MKRSLAKRALAVLLATSLSGAANAADDAFQLFEEEAKVISASFHPTSAARAPATVHVVTAEDIKASGALTIWDALRAVPGVDVVQTRAFQGEVGIRGLNGPLNNRVLVLLDGKTVMNANLDEVLWEGIPVTMEEIARIEVVEGPASALYGANAISGVINIITKTPEQLKGGTASATGGTANFRSGTVLYGTRKGKLDYKVGAGMRAADGFENENVQATQTSKFHALAGYDFSSDSRLSLSGGLSRTNTQTTTGSSGAAFLDTYSSFLRSDYRYEETTVAAFWNRDRGTLRQLSSLSDPPVDYDTMDLSLRHAWSLPLDNRFVAGGNYRHNSVRSRILSAGGASQDLWALFFEDEWTPRPEWTFIAGGRLDRHPLVPFAFSPRGSAIYSPSDAHTFRASVGTSFRNPTLIESYLDLTSALPNPPGGALPNPPFSNLRVVSSGSSALGPERMLQAELSHSGRFGPVRTTLTGFYYELKNLISSTDPAFVSAAPPTVNLATTYRNHGGARALGFEAGVEAAVRPDLTLFSNYSYQSLRDDDPSTQNFARSSPRHKVNAGARLKRGGLTAALWGDWVDKTIWYRSAAGGPAAYGVVPDYLLLNGRVGYEFSGRWDGLEIAVAAFNLADRAHYEVLPASGGMPGQNGEIIRSRWTGTVAYRFP